MGTSLILRLSRNDQASQLMEDLWLAKHVVKYNESLECTDQMMGSVGRPDSGNGRGSFWSGLVGLGCRDCLMSAIGDLHIGTENHECGQFVSCSENLFSARRTCSSSREVPKPTVPQSTATMCDILPAHWLRPLGLS